MRVQTAFTPVVCLSCDDDEHMQDSIVSNLLENICEKCNIISADFYYRWTIFRWNYFFM